MRRFFHRMLHLLRLRRPDAELARELASHLTLLQDAYEARGLSPDAARRAARLALGGVAQVTEQHRDVRSFRWMEDALQDASHGARLLRRSPIFAVTAALSLAIGIGANTAIFTVANALLFRPPTGIVDADRLVVIGTSRGDGGLNPVPYAAYEALGRRATSVGDVFAEGLFARVIGVATSDTSAIAAALGHDVTPSYFTALGVRPARGRLFANGEGNAAVLNHDYWMRRLAGDEGVVGRTLLINGQPIVIVGVAAPGFQGTGVRACDVWLAIGPEGGGSVMAGAKLRPGVPVAAAAAEIATIGDSLERGRGTAGPTFDRLNALPFSRAGGNRNVVFGVAGALMVLVSLVLAAACANVAGIMLTRATARVREITLRAALGAGRGRIVRQLLTEMAVLCLLGGLLGIALARLLLPLSLLLLPPLPSSIVLPLTVDWRVLSFALTLSLGVAALFGVIPAIKGSGVEASAVLKDGARSSSRRSRLRSAFVVGQIACSVLLVVLAAFFGRVLRHAGGDAPGFDPRGVDVATIDAGPAAKTPAERAALWSTLIEHVRQLPGVERAALARVPPGGVEGIGLGDVAAGEHAGSSPMSRPGWNIVEPGYFATLGIPILAGRDFASTDTAVSPLVAVIGETLAQRLWPGRTAIGQPLRMSLITGTPGGPVQRVATVVGVVGDIRSTTLVDGMAEPYVYLALAQGGAVGSGMTAQMSVVARRRGTTSLSGTMATLVPGLDRRLVLANAQSLEAAIAVGLTPQRVLATICGVLGLIAVLLASMGIYGVTAYTVALRRRELAIRLALGAPRGRVLRLVFAEGSWLVGLGLGLGLIMAIGAGRVLSVFFYGLPAMHVPTLLGTAALFVAVGAAASMAPARQAIGAGWRQALQDE